MTCFQAFILGLLQGLTEFLPISSSGHLVIGQKLFRFSQAPVLFDILVHCGTLLAIIFYFNQKMVVFYKRIDNLKLIVVGSIPAALAGFFLNDYLEAVFNSLLLVGLSFLGTGFLLFSTVLVKKLTKSFSQLKIRDAFIIGLFQSLALLPGISRSGSTIISGLWRGIKRKTSFSFSFYLGAPAMLGALLLQLPDLAENGDQLRMGLLGLISAAGSGFLSLKLLEKTVLKGKLSFFAVYCFILGTALLLFNG